MLLSIVVPLQPYSVTLYNNNNDDDDDGNNNSNNNNLGNDDDLDDDLGIGSDIMTSTTQHSTTQCSTIEFNATQ